MVVQDWYYSPSEGEVCVQVNGLSDEEIRLVHKAIEAEHKLAGGVEILIDQDPEGGVMEWWIYRVVTND